MMNNIIKNKKMPRKKFITNTGKYIALIILSIVIVFPIIYSFTNSLMSSGEINKYFGSENMLIHIIPEKIDFSAYFQMLFRSPNYLLKFWNSIFLTSSIVIGQVIVSCLAGYSLAKFNYKYRNIILYIVIVVMLMPYQVTLVSNFIVLEKTGLIGNYLAVILPGIFSPFGVFLLRQVIISTPNEILEAGKLDGANHFKLLYHIIIPRSKSGIISLVILCFIDNWNMVEQPLIFLKDSAKYPLSIFLSQISFSDIALSFSCGILSMIPVLLLYLYFADDLAEGISCSSIK